MKQTITLLAVLLLAPLAVLHAATADIKRDLFYTDAKDKLQSLDVYSPADDQNHPVIVWIHGGGWKRGDKAAVQKKPQAFVDKGFVFVSVNYRFVPAVTLKEMMGDVAKAIRWVRDHAAEHRGDPNSLVIMGHSAGAHLAALVCTDDRYLKAEGVPFTALKGCVPVDVSVYDLPKRLKDGGSVGTAMFTSVFGAAEAELCEFSPVYHIAKGKHIPPFLILHVASREETKTQSHWFAEKLNEAGIAARVVAAEGKTHVTISTDLGGDDDPPTLELWKFLNQITRKPFTGAEPVSRLSLETTLTSTECSSPKMDVKQCGAVGDGVADDTAAIQKALAGGRRLVVIPPGTYKVSAALKVDSDTTIKADAKAVIRLADGAGTNAGVFLLTNRDPERGNTNITVEGGIWDGNNVHNPRGREGDPNGYTGAALNFVNVRHLVLRNLTVRNPEAFSIRFGEVEDFVVEGILFDHAVIRPNQDGVHVCGFCRRGVIRNVRALTPRTTNDDMVALNADNDPDRVINLGMKRGPIRDITVENLRAHSAYTFVRLLSHEQPIENITISGVVGGCRMHAVNLGRWRFPAGGGNIHNVTLRDFTVHKVASGKKANQVPLVLIESAVRGLRIENFRREPSDNLHAPTLVIDNGRQNRLRLEGATGEYDGNKFVLPSGGFALLSVDPLDNGESPAAAHQGDRQKKP